MFRKINFNLIKLVIVMIISLGCSENISIVTTSSDLTLHSEPSVTSKRNFTLIKNTTVLILEKGKKDIIDDNEDNWYKIKFGDYEGWIFGRYLTNQISSEIETEIKYIAGPNVMVLL